ncbi:hypothetical protein [Nocardia africana]|nr:hypothetical protein [Nocardia africana]MCC3312516.1 hypothetical protein [Nocardia africana]
MVRKPAARDVCWSTLATTEPTTRAHGEGGASACTIDFDSDLGHIGPHS